MPLQGGKEKYTEDFLLSPWASVEVLMLLGGADAAGTWQLSDRADSSRASPQAHGKWQTV